MAITFIPERGRILMCDYDLGGVAPEMDKLRRVVVVSPTEINHRHAKRSGVAVVVPFSATPPTICRPCDVYFPRGIYRSLTVDTWAKCAAVSHVSHTRLDRVFARRHRFIYEELSDSDMRRLEDGLSAALGLPLIDR
jgi:uncharacterized protein YifN (PemK superfamily)